MNIVSRKTLTDYGALHSDARVPLASWYKIASSAVWDNLAAVRRTFPSADLVGRLTVFNIGGNKFRLITKINSPIGPTSGTIYVRRVLTHAEYDKEDWKHDPWY